VNAKVVEVLDAVTPLNVTLHEVPAVKPLSANVMAQEGEKVEERLEAAVGSCEPEFGLALYVHAPIATGSIE
jgi:hypothetical protein